MLILSITNPEVYFVGGPWDGEARILDDSMKLPRTVKVFGPIPNAEAKPNDPVEVRTGIYILDSEVDRKYRWDGWR